MGNKNPIPAVATDTWRRGEVATNATTISAMAPKRSDQTARLKNTHHRTSANPPPSPTIAPIGRASGMNIGTPYLASHCTATMTTPGHSGSGF
jgi:hypothetical protein